MASAMAPLAASATSTTSTTPSNSINTMSGGDFLNLMIQQLQQQDPLSPTDSNQLLTQISQISTLQSNTAMEASLKGLTLQQSIGAGGNLIGKKIDGIDENGDPVNGTVTSVKVTNKKIYLALDGGQSLPMENVTTIAQNNGAVAGSTGLDSTMLTKLATALGLK